MPKTGIHTGKLRSILKDSKSESGWALCIGSGTSVPMFPSWNELVKELISYSKTKSNAEMLSQQLLKQFGPDALIQAAYNILRVSNEEFANILSESLYSKVRSKLTATEWNTFKKVQSASHPSSISYDVWTEFDQICSKYFWNCSAYSLAKVIVEAECNDVAPTDILSFNSEIILFSFINLFLWKSHVESHGRKPAVKGQLVKLFDLITQSISTRCVDRIPYILCHGMLPVQKKRKIEKTRKGGIAKLVFAESAYLQLANNSFSWQSSSFLDVCAKRKVVFVGVSLSDPNMRRWLSWLHDNKRKVAGVN